METHKLDFVMVIMASGNARGRDRMTVAAATVATAVESNKMVAILKLTETGTLSLSESNGLHHPFEMYSG